MTNPPDPNLVGVLLTVFLSLGLIGAIIVVVWALVTVRRCPYCNEILVEIQSDARPLDSNGKSIVPPGATYCCPHHSPPWYFGEGMQKGERLDEV